MNEEQNLTAWQESLARLAQTHPYPQTPDLTRAVRQRINRTTSRRRPFMTPTARAVAIAAVILVLLLSLLVAPQTRAAVRELVTRIGAMRILEDEGAAATSIPAPTPPPATAPSSSSAVVTSTPIPLALLAAIPGEPVDVAALGVIADFPVLVPAETSTWGAPDAAVVHEVGGHRMVTQIWEDPERPGTPMLTFSQTDIPFLGSKMIGGDQVVYARVGSNDGAWVPGPHQIQLPIDGGFSSVLIASNVLIWSDETMTYRIEGAINQAEAIELAESLLPAAP